MPKKVTQVEQPAQPVIPLSDGKLDSRIRRSRATILSATAELLFERGLSGVSVDEIVRRSGVAKATIYRHWPTRADLLRDACSMIGTPQTAPNTGSLKSDATYLLVELTHRLKNEKWTSVLPSIIDAAERNSDIADMYNALQTGYSMPLKIVILKAIERGELDKNTDIALLIAALTGPLFFRRWFSREALTADFAKQVVQLVIKEGTNHGRK